MVAALERCVVTPPAWWLVRGAWRPTRTTVRQSRRLASAAPDQPEDASTWPASRAGEISYGTLRFEPYGGKQDKRTVLVRFSVPFRCHSRQMLCVGGSQYPFGWSFVSIAKAPMTWNPRDIWTAEVELPAGMRLEYKYVILEEQVGLIPVWTKQEDDESEGVIELSYRSSDEPFQPPDVKTIRKKMAIVDWQPGPNRMLEVPTEEELARLEPGDVVQRTPARPRPYLTFRKLENLTEKGGDSYTGTWEELRVDQDGSPVLIRGDEWPHKGSGLSFDAARRLFLGD